MVTCSSHYYPATIHLEAYQVRTKNKHFKTNQTSTNNHPLHNLDNQYPSSLIPYNHHNIKSINNKIKTFTNNLKSTKKNSRVLRVAFLKERILEAKLDDNKKHVTYLTNLILIEHQQQMYRTIKHHTK